MGYHQLFNRSYALCVNCKSHAMAHELAYFNEAELMGVINFLTQFMQS